MAYDAGLAERLRELLAERRGITEKRMFGGLSFLRDGHLFVGVSKQDLMVRVGLEFLPEALKRPHTRALRFKTRPTILGYVLVAPEGVDYDDDLSGWIALADQCAAMLPVGPPKPKKPAAAPKPNPKPKKQAPLAKKQPKAPPAKKPAKAAPKRRPTKR
jgi:TfoX/Sxy family transcriptional regulator of competence genes